MSKIKSSCLNCQKEFTYSPKQKRGLYCSNACRAEHVKNVYTRERYLTGQMTERATLRRYIVEDHGYKCAICGIADWQGNKISLQVDHIDGNPTNNMPSNLRMLCPNCHSQTPHFGSKNKGNGRKSRGLSPR